jgi:uncharacterized RDD family membrane protein YckC
MQAYLDSNPQRNLASLGDRFLGQLLDDLVALAAILISLIPNLISERLGNITFLFGCGFALFYILFSDGFDGGQSYGKRVMHTAVIDEDSGAPCTLGRSFIRNFFLVVLGFIDWAFIFGEKRQRLGDRAASTLVVKVPPSGVTRIA